MAKKQIIETPECRTFADTMNAAEAKEYDHLLFLLRETGRLVYPDAEKVETDLFTLRVRVGGNARFFYCYDDGAAVWILNGYEKKTEKIPLREIRQAKRLKRKYGL